LKKAKRLQEERLAVIREQLPVNTTVGLVRKLIAVLETIEKLPVHLYDSRWEMVGYPLQFFFLLNRYRTCKVIKQF
jgi:hypothetical protein